MSALSPIVQFPLSSCREVGNAGLETQPRAADCVELSYEPDTGIGWVTMMSRSIDRPLNFSKAMLDSFDRALSRWESNSGQWDGDDRALQPVHYAVMRSNHPYYFNVGGDLKHFSACILRGEFESLRAYSMQCMDLTCRWTNNVSQYATTISLVQGRALGGGFECALSSDYVIAEEQAEFGFPEILFGLFPCSGGMTLLGGRIGVFQAEKMMRNAKIYSAAEMLELGVIDMVCPQGKGETAVREFITEHSKARPARHALQRARRRMMPVDRVELAAVVDDWVDAARKLSAQNLRVLDTLVRMQGGILRN